MVPMIVILMIRSLVDKFYQILIDVDSVLYCLIHYPLQASNDAQFACL